MLRRYVSVFIGVLAVCVMVFGSAGSAYAGAGGGSDKDDKNDKRVKVIGDGTTAIAGTAVLPSQAQALLDKKNTLSDEYVLVEQGKMDRQTYKEHWRAFLKEVNAPDMEQVVAARGEAVTSEAVAAAAPTSKTLGVTQFPQQKSYWCGPGSANSILQYLNPTSHDGEAVSQSLLANANRKYLETDYWGQTPWSYGANSEFHPYPETLTYWMTGNYYGLYAPVGAPSLTTYKNNLRPILMPTIQWRAIRWSMQTKHTSIVILTI